MAKRSINEIEANFDKKHRRPCKRLKDRFSQEMPDQRMARFRVAEVERVFNNRYGGVLSDDDAGREDMEIIFHHLVRIDPLTAINRMIGWAGRWAPWLSQEEARQLATKIAASPRKFREDHLAQLLNLSMQERTVLGIRTIGAVDATKKERAKIAKKSRGAEES